MISKEVIDQIVLQTVKLNSLLSGVVIEIGEFNVQLEQLEAEKNQLQLEKDKFLILTDKLDKAIALRDSEKAEILKLSAQTKLKEEEIKRKLVSFDKEVEALELEKATIAKDKQDLEEKKLQLSDLVEREQELTKKEKLLERSAVIDRERKEILSDKENNLDQREQKLQRRLSI